jgi:rod shape-determining protein MreC
MYNILRFIGRYHFFFLFLLLEIISFALIFTFNYYPQAIYFRVATSINGKARQITSSVADFYKLKTTNRELAIENSILRTSLPSSFLAIDTNVFWHNDTLYHQRYRYITAHVIGNSISKRNNYIMIDKGKQNGVDIDMGVIGPMGVVGIVVAVSDHFASVMPILHSATMISVKIKKNNELTSVVWKGGNPFKASLINLPGQVNISKGDSVVTSGYSLIFPEGILIGTIDKFHLNTDDNYYDADILLSTRFSSLTYVYVVQNILKDEQILLLKKSDEIIPTEK